MRSPLYWRVVGSEAKRRPADEKAAPGRRAIDVRWLGRIGYGAALELQREAAGRVASGAGLESLLLLEHDPVYTIGRNADASEVLLGPEALRRLGIELWESDRGGRVTYHGPGQLVGYPILNLAPDRRDVKRYVTDLEEVLIRTLADFGVRASRDARKERVSSVWVGNEKIAAIGVHLSRWITTHGFALNVTTNLAHFGGIVPCGITDGGVTSVAQVLGRPVGLAEIARVLVGHFAGVFARVARPFALPEEVK
jgi:lipoyl(octanoyl) transferase